MDAFGGLGPAAHPVEEDEEEGASLAELQELLARESVSLEDLLVECCKESFFAQVVHALQEQPESAEQESVAAAAEQLVLADGCEPLLR